ncbi:hypothetical protein [Niveispirillum sp. KHB5.9]|uniref:hypothetical protein n=1 Tax=Niveispirillum sp. KHB5.9 TaxID=3400269 RepID=UPI003A890BAC
MLRNVLALSALLLAAPAALALPSEPETVREEQRLTLDGREEVWQLVWTGPVRDFCEAVSPEMAMTAPCASLAARETGRLSLRRMRDGTVIDRFDPGPAFEKATATVEAGLSVLPRRAAPDNEYERWLEDEGRFVSAAEQRPPLSVMRFGDYDRDGRAVEFLLQTDAEPQGKPLYAAIGLPAGIDRLGFLRSAGRPDRTLVMGARAWMTLRDQGGPATVTRRACGEQGARTRSDYLLSAANGRIDVTLRDSACPNGPVIEETAW